MTQVIVDDIVAAKMREAQDIIELIELIDRN